MSGAHSSADRWLDATLALAVFGAAIGWFSLTLTRTLEPTDEGYLLTQSLRVASGEVPHRDFLDLYGPAAFGLTGFALRLSGGEVIAVRWLLAAFKAGACALAYLAARPLVPRSLCLVSAALAIALFGRPTANLNTPYAALFSVPLCLLAAVACVRAASGRGRIALFVAGAALGAALLFKQSLGLFIGYGLGLSLVAVAWLASGAGGARRSAVVAGQVLWFGAALVPMVPLLSYLTARDYALHYLPIHALMLAVAWASWQRRAPLPLARSARLLLPFGAGVLAIAVPVVVLYAIWGSLGALLFDTFAFPSSGLRRYYEAVPSVPDGLGGLAVAGLALLHACLLALAGRTRQALAVAGAAALLAVAIFVWLPPPLALRSAPSLLTASGFLAAPLATAVCLGALALLLPAFRSSREEAPVALLGRALPLLFFSAFLCFQVFPRAGVNIWISQGAIAPILAFASWRWIVAAGAMQQTRKRRGAAVVVAALVPLWIAAPVVHATLVPGNGAPRPLALPGTLGLEIPEGEIASKQLEPIERLVGHLARLEDPAAPVLLFSNRELVLFASGRRRLFEDQHYRLFLAAWGMLSEAELAVLDDDSLVARLRAAREAVVVVHAGPDGQRMRAALPRTAGFVSRHYEVVARYGRYSVLERAPAGARP